MREVERDKLEEGATPELLYRLQGRLSFLSDLRIAISESRKALHEMNERR
jgi:hypothetical protein